MKINLIFPKMLYVLLFVSLNYMYSQGINSKLLPTNEAQFHIGFERPFFSSNLSIAALSGVFQLSLNIPISSSLNLIGDIPYINSSYESKSMFGSYSYQEKGLGNLFVGLQLNDELIDNRRSIISFGLFLPTADERASINGLSSNFYDIQKFTPNSLGLYFNYAYNNVDTNGVCYGLEVGPNLLIPTKENGGDAEVFLHGGVNIGYKVSNLFLHVEYLGLAIITQEMNNFGDRFIHMLDIGAKWNSSFISPQIFYKIYLKEEQRQSIDGILGLGVSIHLN